MATEEMQRELERINQFAKTPLTAEQVYTFTLRLCDNEVDRDLERFASEALEELGRLFVGKSGVFDHQWSAQGQTARIYRTEVVEEPAVTTAAGDRYRWLKGWAYLLRTEKNADLIAEIEGGIKQEVSVGCSMGRQVCSICGAEGGCQHVKGQQYGGKLWRCVQAHTSQDGWEPENAPSLWTEICESHGGTLTDPIPYSGNMALESGKYYIQDYTIYLCTRDTGNPVYNPLAELVGIYVNNI